MHTSIYIHMHAFVHVYIYTRILCTYLCASIYIYVICITFLWVYIDYIYMINITIYRIMFCSVLSKIIQTKRQDVVSNWESPQLQRKERLGDWWDFRASVDNECEVVSVWQSHLNLLLAFWLLRTTRRIFRFPWHRIQRLPSLLMPQASKGLWPVLLVFLHS